MPFDIASIVTSRAQKPPRIILIGGEKVGKSTWAAGAPSPLFIAVKGETGLDNLDVPMIPQPVGSFDELLDVLRALAEQEHDRKTVVIDSITTFEPLLIEHACKIEGVPGVQKLGGGYGAQEGVLVGYARTVMDWLDYLRDVRGLGCILIAHIKPNPKTFNDPETDPYDTYKAEMRDSLASAYYRWADAILFATTKKYTKQIDAAGGKKITHAIGNGERVMYTEKRPAWTAGNRYGLPFELPLSYPAFAAALAAATAPRLP
jgi:hypothetical protein